MKKTAQVCCLALSILCPMAAVAQAYKCKQADGSTSFQDRPCQGGAKESSVTLAPSRGEPAQAAEPVDGSGSSGGRKRRTKPFAPEQGQVQDAASQRADEAVRAHNAEVDAYNKMQRCNFARRQLGVLKESRPAFRRDNEGERHYIDDKNRAGEVAAAEQRVAAECR